MLTVLNYENAGQAWLHLLGELFTNGHRVTPRGRQTRELLDVTWCVRDARQNLWVHPHRNLSYKFAVAEWLWIWFGHDDVRTIAQYNKHIAQFSDNGSTFDGAYGPLVRAQWPLVIANLNGDPDSRQAVMQIFRRSIRPWTRDVPCTLTVQFILRHGKLHTIVNMRSSDVWLGLPYDCYNFSMLANITASVLGVVTGGIIFHLGSSHLYEDDAAKAFEVLQTPKLLEHLVTPQHTSAPPAWLDMVLTTKVATEETPLEILEWGRYSQVLTSPTQAEALAVLR